MIKCLNQKCDKTFKGCIPDYYCSDECKNVHQKWKKKKIWFENVSLSDGRELVKWWNGHTIYYFFLEPHPVFKGCYQVTREAIS